MTRRRFILLAALVGWFAHDGKSQVHMSAGTVPLTDARGVSWTPNICTGWNAFPNPGTYSSPIYNTTAYTAVSGVPITCIFQAPNQLYWVIFHLIEAVKTFNIPQRRLFDIYANGIPLITNVDIYTRAGGVELPVDVTAVAPSSPDGTLTISFRQVQSSALFAAIELFPLWQEGPHTTNNEIPVGVINGDNNSFSLAHKPIPGTVCLYLNGLRIAVGDGSDGVSVALSGSTLLFPPGVPPQAGDSLLVDYTY